MSSADVHERAGALRRDRIPFVHARVIRAEKRGEAGCPACRLRSRVRSTANVPPHCPPKGLGDE